MLNVPILLIIYISTPFIIIFLNEKYLLVAKINPVIWTYIIGITLGNTGLIPISLFPVLELLSGISVIIALPLLLFSIDLSRWKELSGKAGLSMLYAFIAIIVSSILGVLLFGNNIPESSKIAGLMIGVYTGGTPNLAALKIALKVQTTTYLAVHTADVLITGIYFLFLITIGKNIFRRILPAYNKKDTIQDNIKVVTLESLKMLISHKIDTFTSLTLTIFIFAAGFGISLLFPKDSSTIVLILSVTTVALILSNFKQIRKLKSSFTLGEIFILIFCIIVGSMADISQLIKAIPEVIQYVSFSVFVSILLHTLLCKVSGIDADTMIITSTSAIYSPPFVPVVAVALGNKEIIFAGISTGLVGYAAGNYLGVIISNLLDYLL